MAAGGGGGLQGGQRDGCWVIVVVEGEEEEEGRRQWEGADYRAVVLPLLRDLPAGGSEHVVPPRLPPGDRAVRCVLRDGRQRDGEDHQ